MTLTLLLAPMWLAAKPAVFYMPDGRTLSISPISDYWNTNFIADDWLMVWAQPGYTNWNASYFQLMTQLGNDSRLLAALAANGATGPVGPQGPQGPAGADGTNGAPGSNGNNGAAGQNGTNGTNLTRQPAATLPSATNSLNLTNMYWLLATSGSGALTNIVWDTTNFMGTLVVSNSGATTNTFLIATPGEYFGPNSTNLLTIAPHKRAIASFLLLGGTNIVTCNQQ